MKPFYGNTECATCKKRIGERGYWKTQENGTNVMVCADCHCAKPIQSVPAPQDDRWRCTVCGFRSDDKSPYGPTASCPRCSGESSPAPVKEPIEPFQAAPTVGAEALVELPELKRPPIRTVPTAQGTIMAYCSPADVEGYADLLVADLAILREQLKAAQEEIGGYKEWAVDVKRLCREIDVAMNGKDAAQQASLCDLVMPIEILAKQHKQDVERMKKARELLQRTIPHVDCCNGDCDCEGDRLAAEIKAFLSPARPEEEK